LGYAAAMRNDFFYEPERGGGVVGWAVRQLVLWLVGGLAVYWLVTSYALVRPSSGPAAEPQAQLQPQSQVPAADLAPAERAALGRPAPIVSNALSLAFDTGASMVSLTQADAARAGVAGNLNYTLSFGTANGRGLGAPVTLREIRIGQLVVQDVNAVVMQNLNVSLLGQTFLKRLDSYQMKDSVLTLTWQ
jgi:aspartyl protease family protein